jgi:hypothetical protein
VNLLLCQQPTDLAEPAWLVLDRNADLPIDVNVHTFEFSRND